MGVILDVVDLRTDYQSLSRPRPFRTPSLSASFQQSPVHRPRKS
jgi:hypothetical protein